MIDQGVGIVEVNNADLLMGLSLQDILGLAAPSLVSGLTIANSVGDPTNDVDFPTGICRDSTNVITLVALTAMTKQLDVAWAAGTGQGGRMSAAAIANTTYFCFAILKDDDQTVDFGFDTSPTAPTLPTGYTFFRRIGAILREAGAIVLFTKVGGYNFIRTSPIQSYSVANPGISAVLVPLDVPKGIVVQALFTAFLTDLTPSGSSYMLVTSPFQADSVPSATLFNLAVAGNAINAASDMSRVTDTSGQIRYRISVSDADHTVKFITNGWVDRLES